ncbi:serine hydrolase domain-containing protein [Streptomyces sp. NPDC055992]|uniref:serine hydrolase domain-containing protein n=1 Tax=Streptomyces sp. NPDC055992 TaxID=3345673 RepID=UPI0035E0E278
MSHIDVLALSGSLRADSHNTALLRAARALAPEGLALVTALLVQDGVVDLDRPVARDWPEFAAAGKAGLTLRDLLAHRAGLLGTPEGLSDAELAEGRPRDTVAVGRAGQRRAGCRRPD